MKKNKISKILSMLLVCVVTLGTTALEKNQMHLLKAKHIKKKFLKL